MPCLAARAGGSEGELRALLRCYASENMESWLADPKVGNVNNDFAEILEKHD